MYKYLQKNVMKTMYKYLQKFFFLAIPPPVTPGLSLPTSLSEIEIK